MNKIAITPGLLQPYQRRVVQKISDPTLPGLVVAHGVGSGKTRSSIAAYQKLNMPSNVIVPAALGANYEKELRKWVGKVPDNVNIQSQQRVARQGITGNTPNRLEIVDEAHRLRGVDSTTLRQIRKSQAAKRLLLTGTPIVNHPTDLSTLVNLAAKRKLLPEDKTEFNNQYVEEKKVNPGFLKRMLGVKPGLDYRLINKGALKKIYSRYVDYHPGSAEGFPTVDHQEIKVPMGQGQHDVYRTILGKAPLWVRMKVKSGLPPAKSELKGLQAFLSGARQVSNTTKGFVQQKQLEEGAKIQKAFQYLQGQIKQNPRYKGVVYSNYLNSGLAPYKELLDKNKIPYGEFSGDVTPAVRNKLVEDYNRNKLKALLISSAGAEGLDLKGTRLIQILEPHFNEEKEKQIIGRGVRYQSHADLSPAERNVMVQRYMAQPRASMLGRMMGNQTVRGTDEYIRNIALQKTRLNKEVLQLLNESTTK